MSAYDLVNNIKVVNAVNSAAVTDDSSESAAIDTAGFESVTVVAQMAAFTSGAGKFPFLNVILLMVVLLQLQKVI